MTRWLILTGEYPPQRGGVSDYTQLVAEGIVAAGDSVEIIAPHCNESRDTIDRDNLRVHRLIGGFCYRNFRKMEHLLDAASPDRILIQYVPHAFGWKGMNVPFARWVRQRLIKYAPIVVMFHEVVFPFSYFPLRHAFLAKTTEYMARLVAAAAEQILVSIPAWEHIVRRLLPSASRIEWMPVPSTSPSDATVEDIRIARRRFGTDDGILLGHFGTYGSATAILLPVLAQTLTTHKHVRALLIGRGSERILQELSILHPELSDRLSATGGLPASAITAHIKACDLMVQPYPDGVSSRRSSIMPSLACGVPVVTNLGLLSEAFWTDRGVAAASAPEPEAITAAVSSLLLDSSRRFLAGTRGALLYQEYFAIEHTISRLRSIAL